MAILFSKKGTDAKWLEPVGYQKEEVLQQYIEDNPHSIPLSEYKEDANLVIICNLSYKLWCVISFMFSSYIFN